MLDILNLALPFFCLIFLGFVCGKIKRLPDHGLVWMGFFVVYVALPALFYRILAQTPFAEFAQVWFIVGTTLSTFSVFIVSFAISYAMRRRNLAEATIAALAGSYANIGFMGPGLAIATLGAQATAPVALIFCFDQFLLFTLVPLLMSFAGDRRRSPLAAPREVGIRIGTTRSSSRARSA